MLRRYPWRSMWYHHRFLSLCFPLTGRPFSWDVVVAKAFIKYVNEKAVAFLASQPATIESVSNGENTEPLATNLLAPSCA